MDTIKTGDPVTGEGGDKYEDLVAKYGEPDIKSDSTSKNIKRILLVGVKMQKVAQELISPLVSLKKMVKS